MKYKIPCTILALLLSSSLAADETTYEWQTTSGGMFSSSQAAIEQITGQQSFPFPFQGGLLYVVPGRLSGTFTYDPDDASYLGQRGTIEAYVGSSQAWTSHLETGGSIVGSLTGDSGETLVRDGDPTGEPDLINVNMCTAPWCGNGVGFTVGDWRANYSSVVWVGEGFQDDFQLPGILPPPGAPQAIALFGVFNPVTGENASIIAREVVITEAVQIVDIEINPQSGSSCINVNGHGVIPVAVLGDENLDVAAIDQSSLAFGGLTVRVRGNKLPQCSYDYVNEDTDLDLICKFEDDSSAWVAGEDEATMEGALMDGTPIKGSDALCLVP